MVLMKVPSPVSVQDTLLKSGLIVTFYPGQSGSKGCDMDVCHPHLGLCCQSANCMCLAMLAHTLTALLREPSSLKILNLKDINSSLRETAGADILRSWFAGFLRSREIAEIDKVIQNEQGGGGSSSTRSSQPEGTDRPMGPLQVQH